jgi:2-succinyl-5-enolpyruvyl-6-hydroxy-3-cyclohexene-1-carboxylate synthase
MNANPAIECAHALLSGLVAAGVEVLVACPGARSAPLAWTCEAAGLHVIVQHDERSAGFVALGIARTSGKPVALSCTSGSALANFAPAIVEAQAAHVSLIVISADRPPELHGCDAPQTMPQAGSLGAWTVAQVVLPVADATTVAVAWEHAGLDAARQARALSGPVHINAPFREPLQPFGEESFRAVVAEPGVEAAPPSDAERTSELPAATRPVVLLGPWSGTLAELEELAGCCARLGIPVLADPLSGARALPVSAGIVAAYDALLRESAVRAALRPDVIVRVGAPMTSKATQQWVASTPDCRVEVWSEGARWTDPAPRRIDQVSGCARDLIGLLAGSAVSVSPEWTARWTHLSFIAEAALARALGEPDAPVEVRAVASAARICAPDDLFHVASSMPVRLADTGILAAGCAAAIHCNRGVNGIDGTISTACGEWLGSDRKGRVWVVIGDVAMLHDLTGLMPALQHDIPMTVLVLNNDGGGIFHHLALADGSDVFERFFGTAHGLTFASAAEQFGFHYEFVDDGEPASALQRSLSHRRALVEARSDRNAEVAGLRRIWARVGAAAAAAIDDAEND